MTEQKVVVKKPVDQQLADAGVEMETLEQSLKAVEETVAGIKTNINNVTIDIEALKSAEKSEEIEKTIFDRQSTLEALKRELKHAQKAEREVKRAVEKQHKKINRLNDRLEKVAQKEAERLAKKEAREAERAAKKAELAAKKAAAKPKRIEKNGKKLPNQGTTAWYIWERISDMSGADEGQPLAEQLVPLRKLIEQLKNEVPPKGDSFNVVNIRNEYSAYRKFHGLQGFRVVDAEKEAERKAKKEAAKKAAKERKEKREQESKQAAQ